MQELEQKLEQLKEHLASYGKVAVAFSAGVDSSFLLAVAHDVLGDAACALTAQSPAFPAREHADALTFCQVRGIRQIVFDAEQFAVEGFVENGPQRCYYCKRALFSKMLTLAETEGLGQLVDGSNTDDLADYRPGGQALQELGVQSPLVTCGFSKQEIRDASRLLHLASADKASLACLATRFAYGQTITQEGLERVDATESALLAYGMSTVRVRVNGDEARIEVLPQDFPVIMNNRERVLADVKDAGFAYVALDLQGYRSGAMNETL